MKWLCRIFGHRWQLVAASNEIKDGYYFGMGLNECSRCGKEDRYIRSKIWR